jgi:hypothetical protein
MRSPGRGSRHADDVARRAKLTVLAGRVELAEEVFVEVALHVGIPGERERDSGMIPNADPG